MSKEQSAYRQSLKSLDTEEGIDLAFYRPIGYMWARLAARLRVTPQRHHRRVDIPRHRSRSVFLLRLHGPST